MLPDVDRTITKILFWLTVALTGLVFVVAVGYGQPLTIPTWQSVDYWRVVSIVFAAWAVPVWAIWGFIRLIMFCQERAPNG